MPLHTRFQPDKVHPAAFIAPGAVIVGDVTIGDQASVWFSVVVRGDVEAVVIGDETNVQDGCILHADHGEPCRLGRRVSLGHGAVVHAAVVDDDVLVGIRAIVLNRAHIGTGSLIAAGALVPPDTVIPPGSVVMGVPGRVVRQATPADRERIGRTAERYVAYAREYRETHAAGHPAAGAKD
jgi:carbonic anhydrase/acetyltransferase-like protein (isoleucine patch superfamily)